MNDSHAGLDFGGRTIVWRLGGKSLRVSARTILVRSILLTLALVLAIVGVTTGTYVLSLGEFGQALVGDGREIIVRMVWEWRLPRVLFALIGGIALAVSGSIFQSLTRNPLGSPDVIGFDAGAYTGALIVMLVLGSTAYAPLAVGAVVGGAVTALAVYLLAWRNGVQGFRFIIVGIGLAAFLTGINNYLLIRTGAEEARAAVSWGFGSFASLGFEQFWPFVGGVAVLLALVATQATAFGQLELGDDAAAALGVRTERIRFVMVLLGVGLTAAVTAAAGPIAFLALVAPQLARRLTRARGLDIPSSALTGGVLLLTADLVGQRIDISVGLVTVVLGGGYFLWLLINEGRRR